MSNGRTGLRWALVIGLTATAILTVAAMVGVVVALRSVLPDKSAAARHAQTSADAAAPGLVHVDGARWSGEAGGYGIDAHLVDDPGIALRWHAARDGHCDRGEDCNSVIPAQIAAARARTAEVRALQRSFAPCTSATGHTDNANANANIDSFGLTDQLVLRVPVDGLDGVLAGLDTCARALPAARAGLPEQHRIVIATALEDTDGASVGATAAILTDGVLTTSTTRTVVPSTGGDPEVDDRITAAVSDWLTRHGSPPALPLTVDQQDTRFLPGRGDRIRHYVPLPPQPGQAPDAPARVVAVTTDRDGTGATDLQILPVVAGVAQDPLAPPPQCLPWEPAHCTGSH